MPRSEKKRYVAVFEATENHSGHMLLMFVLKAEAARLLLAIIRSFYDS